MTAQHSLRILLVEEKGCIRQILGELLRAGGHSVDTAVNGLTGVTLFKTGQWDMVITDRSLPWEDGNEVAERIKEHAPETPVLMIAALDQLDASSAVDGYIRKPFIRAEILDTIERCASLGSAGDEESLGNLVSAA